MPLPVVAIAQAIAQSFARWFRWSSVGFPNLKTDMFVLMITVMFMGGGWRVKWSPRGYGYFIGLPGSWHHHPCRADEFHLDSIMSIWIVKLSLYCKANAGNNWLVRFLMALERRTGAHVNNSFVFLNAVGRYWEYTYNTYVPGNPFNWYIKRYYWDLLTIPYMETMGV